MILFQRIEQRFKMQSKILLTVQDIVVFLISQNWRTFQENVRKIWILNYNNVIKL